MQTSRLERRLDVLEGSDVDQDDGSASVYSQGRRAGHAHAQRRAAALGPRLGHVAGAHGPARGPEAAEQPLPGREDGGVVPALLVHGGLPRGAETHAGARGLRGGGLLPVPQVQGHVHRALGQRLRVGGSARVAAGGAARVMSNEAFLFFLCVFLPTCFALTATYSEDRAARMAYASKVRAERINTTLKLDLSVKQIGLENRNAMTRDEKEALERALSATGDMELFMTVSIPFADLKLKEILAKTPNGEVLVGEYHQTDVVVKRLAQSCLTAEGLAAFKSKVELLACLRHPNIVLFIGATFDNLSNVGLVMEYLERGDVLSLLRSPIALAWSDPLLKIATDVAQGVSYLHNCDPPLVHRDLKSSNLLCTRTYSCKVSDFGESKRQLLPGKLFSTIVGTPYWLAPEILREERYDTQVDCYSFGVILVELETRHEPYHDLPKDYTTIDIMMGVSRGDLRPTIPPSCSPCRRELIARCLDNDPKRRPKMTEILYALQHKVRQELLDQNSTDVVTDKRRLVLMQQHQRLNRRGLQDLMRSHDDD
ncbi:hypothetical protein ON010_g16875 [Phytophthora cinnamomi]|nr:hypothetical protein ON010_g16875 [Phytophthora cinnamomi]